MAMLGPAEAGTYQPQVLQISALSSQACATHAHDQEEHAHSTSDQPLLVGQPENEIMRARTHTHTHSLFNSSLWPVSAVPCSPACYIDHIEGSPSDTPTTRAHAIMHTTGMTVT